MRNRKSLVQQTTTLHKSAMLEGKKDVTASKTELEFLLLFQRVAFPPASRILYYVAVRCKMETVCSQFSLVIIFTEKNKESRSVTSTCHGVSGGVRTHIVI